jgi:predicted nucleotidyltransferase/uncharacterized protein (UPF0332 family)
MVTKKISKKSQSKKKTISKKKYSKKKISKKKIIKKTSDIKKIPTLKLQTEHAIAMDFAVKAQKRFNKIIKSIALFGSLAKRKISLGSDIDIVIIIDDVSINWDQELIAWYREELDNLILKNPYRGSLHINTIKLSTWWQDLLKGDPVVLNVLRSGEVMIDSGGFFEPLKYLLLKGKIKGTPEAIYTCLQRAPTHLARSRAYELKAIEGIYWSMVDAAQAALMAANFFPPTPEHILGDLKEAFSDKNILKSKYVNWFRDMIILHKKIDHGEIKGLKGTDIDLWQEHADEFIKIMVSIVKKLIIKD